MVKAELNSVSKGRFNRLIDPRWLLVLACLITLVSILWIPFGIRTPDIVEGWTIKRLWDLGQIPYDLFNIRPLVLVPWGIANFFDPNSFLLVNLLFMFTLVSKGILMCALVKRLSNGNWALALAAGVLLLVYPSDTAITDQRTLNIHCAITIYLLAVNLLFRAWEKPTLPRVIVMSAALIVDLLTYEGAFALAFFSPLLLLLPLKSRDLSTNLAQNEIKKSFWAQHRRQLFVPGVWYVSMVIGFIPLIRTALALLTNSNNPADENYISVLAGGVKAPDAAQSIATHFIRAYSQHFVDGWRDAISYVQTSPSLLPLAFVVAILVSVALVILIRNRQRDLLPWRQYLLITLIGLVALFLGYALYLLSTERFHVWRVFLFASIGATLALVAAAWLVSVISRFQRVVFPILIVPLFLVSTLRGLALQQQMHQGSLNQLRILAGIVEEVPRIRPPGKLILLTETSSTKAQTSFYASSIFDAAIAWIYHDYPLESQICYSKGEWGGFNEFCDFQEQEVVITAANFGHPVHIPYDELIVLEYGDDTGISVVEDLAVFTDLSVTPSNYQPYHLIDLSSPPPLRGNNLFPDDIGN